MSITGLLSIFLAAILTNNYILSKFLGICPFLGVSKKLDTAVSMSAAVIVVMVVATAVTWPIQTLLLDPPLYQALGVYLPLITTNCAVLGVTTLNISSGYNYIESLINSFGSGVGFLVAMVLFAGVRGRLETADIPKSLQGLPITLVSASIVACSFLGFGGLVDGIFK